MGMKMRKPAIFAVVGCAAAVVLLFAYIKKDNQNISKTEEQTVITVTYASGDDSWNKSVSKVCDAFSKKYPDIRVKMQPSTKTQSGFYDDYLKKQIATGELGDVVELKNIKMASQEGLFAALPDELTELIQDTWTAPDGSVYTLPLVRTEMGIIYNKSVFESLRLTPPGTWQEFEALCKVLKEKGYTPLVVGGGDSWHLLFWFRYFFNSCITSENTSWQKDCTLGNVQWTDEQPAEMLARYTGLFEKGYVNRNYEVTGDANTCEYIADSKAVMLYSLSNQIPKIQGIDPSIKLGWFFMPDDTGRRYSYSDNQSGWGISAECGKDEKKYDAAIKFLKFFYSEEIYGEICGIMNGLPVTRKETAIENELLKEISGQAGGGVLKPSVWIGDEDTPEGFPDSLCRGLLEAAKGEKTQEQVLLEYQADWEKRAGR